MKPLAWMDIDHDWDVISAHHKTDDAGAYGSKNLERYSRPLYASAPDLLASLIEVVAIADRKTDAFDRARAVIARATGEAA